MSHSGIGLADYVIAATVDLRGYELGTLNVRHYPMLPNLEWRLRWARSLESPRWRRAAGVTDGPHTLEVLGQFTVIVAAGLF